MLASIAILVLAMSLWFANNKALTAEEAKLSALVELSQLKLKCGEKSNGQ